MARLSRTGGKASKAKARKAKARTARPAKGGQTAKAKTSNANTSKAKTAKARTAKAKTAKTRRRTSPAATLHKRLSVSDLETQLDLRTKQLDEALALQAATADILNVISSSVADTAPVFEQILDSCERLAAFERMAIFVLGEDGQVHIGAYRGSTGEALRATFPQPLANTPMSLAFERQQILFFGDVLNNPDAPQSLRIVASRMGSFSVLVAPLLWEGRGIGAFHVSRDADATFTDGEVALFKTFADQAVIAIRNARLFNETREALERQTVTADILKVIASSPADVQPVFKAIADSAKRLLGGHSALVTRVVDDMIHLAAFTQGDEAGDNALQALYPYSLFSERPHSRVAVTGKLSTIADTETETNVPQVREAARARGYRSLIVIPMLHKSIAIGTIGVMRREAGPFKPADIDLLQTFADQAVIAIENARLFNETREALERQTATSEVLKVIASSPSDVRPVFDAIAASANRLIGGYSTAVHRVIDDIVHLVAFTPTNPESDEALKALFPRHRREVPSVALVQNGETAQIADAETADPQTMRLGRARGWRSVTFTPLMSKGAFIGFIACTRQETGVLADHHVQLVRTFADQAVIAIENVRLFDEVQAKTRDLSESLQQQTATADVLKVISRSTFDLQTVLETLIRSAVDLSGANRGSIFLREGDVFPLKAASHTTPEFLQYWAANPPRAGRGSATHRVIGSGKIEIIPDVLEDPEMEMPPGALARIRATLGVPMLRDNKVEGVLVLTRPEPGQFSKSQIDLVQTFADQAVIAVENVRLFDETQARSKELAASLEELRTAQDRLVQTEKLASLGQLTAGIAHEIKNPLNFINNFSSLSAELIDELDEALTPAALDQNTRDGVSELTAMLKSNLEKVVQHGKRADSIVKNMLLHSREGSGEHRAADINALVEESLNLAYHGARAEKSAFNITLTRDLDPEAGSAELYPQEITRALLNFITNGFYAATRRKAEAADENFEPALRATTKNLGKAVEIRIRDNGTGIPPDVKEKMFNPFFTTKPAGEGTGLGLSMSHDIIVKQHGGRIDVETEPGLFTEFIITLPRHTAALPA